MLNTFMKSAFHKQKTCHVFHFMMDTSNIVMAAIIRGKKDKCPLGRYLL